jgi:hypothetical protein
MMSKRARFVGLLATVMLAVGASNAAAVIVHLPGRAIGYEPVPHATAQPQVNSSRGKPLGKPPSSKLVAA